MKWARWSRETSHAVELRLVWTKVVAIEMDGHKVYVGAEITRLCDKLKMEEGRAEGEEDGG